MAENIDAFPTLIRAVDLLSKNQCEDIAQYIHTLTDTFEHGLLVGEGVSNYSLTSNILGNISDTVGSCRDLQTKIEYELNRYMELSGIAHIKLSNSWMNIQRSGSKLIKHTHPGAFITGAIYIKADEYSSPIDIHNPNPFISFTAICKQTKYTDNSIRIQPTTGKMILFPSWLLHGTNEINQTDERIVISFNSGII